MGTLYSRPVSRDYSSAGFGGVLLRLFDIFLGWVVPFLVAFFTYYFWFKEFTFYEQPETTFLNKAVIEVLGRQEGSDAVTKLHWVSLPLLEDLVDNRDLSPVRFDSYEEDVNSDGVVDRMFFEMDVPLPTGFRAYTFAAVLLFQFTTGRATDSKIIEIDMETMCEVAHASPLPLSEATIDGDLKFQQRGPLIHERFTSYSEIYNISLFDVELITSPAQVQLSSVVSNYAARNETTFVEERGRSSQPDTLPSGDARSLAVHLNLRNVKQAFVHRAHPVTSIKFGLVQYFTFWYMFSSLAGLVRMLLVTGGLVDTVAQCNEIDDLRRRRVY